MRNKAFLGAVCLLLILIAILAVRPISQGKVLEARTMEYITSLGYPEDSVLGIRVEHSYSGKILGYNEWRISAGFRELPELTCWFIWQNGQILPAGVSGDPMLDKDQVIEYSERFKNGTLLDR